MTETAAPTRFVVISRTEEHGDTKTSASPTTSKATAAATACEDRWSSRARNGSQTRWAHSWANQPTRPATDSVRASLLYSYAGAGRSGIFIMISFAPSLYR